MLTFTPILLRLVTLSQQKVPFVYQTRGTFLSDAFLAERDAHCVRDAGLACDARLRRVSGTHRITYHSAAASLITYLQNGLICDILQKARCMLCQNQNSENFLWNNFTWALPKLHQILKIITIYDVIRQRIILKNLECILYL